MRDPLRIPIHKDQLQKGGRMATNAIRMGRALVCALAAGGLLLAASSAQARPDKKLWLGLGAASSSVSGGLDGNQVFYADPTNGPFVYAGKPEKGSGLVISGGAVISKSLAAELQFISTNHDATHAGLPGQNLTLSISELLASLRLMVPLEDSMEVFGRAGLGIYAVGYDNNTQLPPNPTLISSSFGGAGLALGGGVAFFFDPLGLELAIMTQSASLDTLSAGGTEGQISGTDLKQTTVTLTLTGHFGT